MLHQLAVPSERSLFLVPKCSAHPLLPFASAFLTHNLMPPPPSTLTSHDQNAPRHLHIHSSTCFLCFPSFVTSNGAIKRLRQLVEADQTSMQQAETHDRFTNWKFLVCGEMPYAPIQVLTMQCCGRCISLKKPTSTER